MTWTHVMEEKALPEGGMAPVYPRGVHLLLARVEGTVYALEGKCVHMACPLFTGTPSGHTLTCPCHDWRFDVRSGRFLDAPGLGLVVFPSKTEAGNLFVDID